MPRPFEKWIVYRSFHEKVIYVVVATICLHDDQGPVSVNMQKEVEISESYHPP